MFDVVLLGTGGMTPLKDRWLASMLVRFNGSMVLTDCGEGTQIPFKEVGWGFKRLDAILFTHFHADHIAGLPGLLLTVGTGDKTDPLYLIGPPGMAQVAASLLVIAPAVPFPIYTVELPNDAVGEYAMGDYMIRSLPVRHSSCCLAYSLETRRAGRFDAEKAKRLGLPLKSWNRLQKGEKYRHGERTITPDMVMGPPRRGFKVSYCTDTRPVGGLPDFVSESDLLVCEGMYGNGSDARKARQKLHMTMAEAAALAKKGKVAEVWLTHFSPSLVNPPSYEAQYRKAFGSLSVGHDGMARTLTYGED
ncbi:MAG: ribonuclease Z [Oscillospiraceae bacterium]|nr:ribonuclease Z [Oscillospiraceae bacterium]